LLVNKDGIFGRDKAQDYVLVYKKAKNSIAYEIKI